MTYYSLIILKLLIPIFFAANWVAYRLQSTRYRRVRYYVCCYSNGLPIRIFLCKIQIHADDVKLYLACNIPDFRSCRLNLDLDITFKWASTNGLSLNARNSKAIAIGKMGTLPDLLRLLQLGDFSARFEKNGVMCNSQLTWTDHINVACGRTYYILRNLWKTEFFTF